MISPPVIVDTPTGSSSSGIRGQAAEHGGGMRSPSVHPDARSFAPFKLTRPTPFISVVFPCLNEEASVGRCVDEAKSALAKLASWERFWSSIISRATTPYRWRWNMALA